MVDVAGMESGRGSIPQPSEDEESSQDDEESPDGEDDVALALKQMVSSNEERLWIVSDARPCPFAWGSEPAVE